MPTMAEIEAALEEIAGQQVLARCGRPPDPHANDLPVRDILTGQIVAYVGEEFAEGLQPVIRNGLVVGYYKDEETRTLHPFFLNGVAIGMNTYKLGERWMSVFDDDGRYLGNRRIK